MGLKHPKKIWNDFETKLLICRWASSQTTPKKEPTEAVPGTDVEIETNSTTDVWGSGKHRIPHWKARSPTRYATSNPTHEHVCRWRRLPLGPPRALFWPCGTQSWFIHIYAWPMNTVGPLHIQTKNETKVILKSIAAQNLKNSCPNTRIYYLAFGSGIEVKWPNRLVFPDFRKCLNTCRSSGV